MAVHRFRIRDDGPLLFNGVPGYIDGPLGENLGSRRCVFEATASALGELGVRPTEIRQVNFDFDVGTVRIDLSSIMIPGQQFYLFPGDCRDPRTYR